MEFGINGQPLRQSKENTGIQKEMLVGWGTAGKGHRSSEKYERKERKPLPLPPAVTSSHFTASRAKAFS